MSAIAADESLAETMALLVSELVTNAVVHTGRPAVLRLYLPAEAAGEATVRLEVDDISGRAPAPRCPSGESTGGRGLALVECLADRWGWVREGAGKRVWCELDRTTGTSAPPSCGAGTVPYGGLAYEAV